VQTGLFDLYEIENGEFRLTGASKNLIGKTRLPVTDYFKTQGRFKSLDENLLKKVQERVDAKWAKY
jgi:pyruvate ferredoxin oxidoreductase beta subunit